MLNKAIFDSGIFIGSQYSRDQYSKDATRILENLKDGEIRKIYVTNYVLAECVNFLLKKTGFEKAQAAFNYLTETDNIEIIEIDDLKIIKEIFQRYRNLSITDCSLIALSEKLKIKEIFSFDKHFDSVRSITRLTSLQQNGA